MPQHVRKLARNKALAATAICAATVLGVAGLTAGGASAADRGVEPANPTADYNNDGYADLAVGVPGATVGGKAKAGYVNVVWGGKSGLGKHGSTTVSQSTAGVPGTAEAGDGFGTAVDSNDMNGDGYSDLIVGAPDEDTDAGLSAGTVAVVWGAANGFKGGFTAANGQISDGSYGAVLASGDFDDDGDQDIALNSHFDESSSIVMRPGPFTAGSPSDVSRVEGWHFAGPRTMAAGDFDDDGKDDLAFSYAGMEVSGTSVMSREAGSGEWKTTWSTGDSTDTALAAGDFDGDNTTDLAIGNVRPNPESETTYCEERLGGAIATVYGKKGTTLGGPSSCTTQSGPQVGGDPEAEDNFGAHLASLDSDQDGREELIAGADSEAVGTAKNAGSYWFLTSTGAGTTLAGPAFSQNTAGVAGTAEAGDRLGAAVTAGDYNGDGLPDFAVGAPGEDAKSGGVWYAATPTDGPSPAVTSVTPGKLGLAGASGYGAVLSR
ncbi:MULTISPECIES: FG-GAP repeat protein [unclassified Streptomyces]|uniref:FG-GAP repeat protein n=1 Tax=unclassified Streptomyces TaxID=2593676 RepID=UPI0033E0A6B2